MQEVFSFHATYVLDQLSGGMGFPIQKSADQRVLAPPRSLSQPVTSFIACNHQGIHRMPFSCLICIRIHSSIMFAHNRRVWRLRCVLYRTKFSLVHWWNKFHQSISLINIDYKINYSQNLKTFAVFTILKNFNAGNITCIFPRDGAYNLIKDACQHRKCIFFKYIFLGIKFKQNTKEKL